jgi:hypothetical protein
MDTFSLTTGFISTHPIKFKNEADAWNSLSRDLNLHYGIPKGGKDNKVIAVMRRHYRIYSIHKWKWDGNNEVLDGHQDICSGYISLDYMGTSHEYTKDELASVNPSKHTGCL